MKTAYITVEEQRPKRPKGYPVRLYFDDGQSDWMQKKRALAAAVIPADMQLANPPEDPVMKSPLAGDKLREIFLVQKGSSPRFEVIGSYLYQLLFQGKVREVWETLRAQYPNEAGQAEGLRTFIDIAPQTLRLLPWELMFDDAAYLFLDPAHPFVRGPANLTLQCAPCYWPVHVLVVVGAADDDPVIKVTSELFDIEDALIKFGRPVDLEVLTRPTNEELADKLQKFQPHVFHFIGHGQKASLRDTPVLVFESNGTNNRWEWGDKKITRDLRANWVPRFAFLNACRSSDAAKDVERVMGIGDAFANAGVAAVLGMQADVQNGAATRFAGNFYGELAKDTPLDVALTKARNAVSRIDNDGLERRDWALATLALAVPPELVLPMRPTVTPAFRNAIDARFSKYSDFVDRVATRRTLWSGLEPQPNANQIKNLLIIKGAEEVGKTWLVHWSLKNCAWRERKIAYVSLKKALPGEVVTEQGARDFLQVLHLIAGNAGDPDALRSHHPAAFVEFDQTVAQLRNHLPQPAQPAALAPGMGLPGVFDHSEIETIFGAFKTALQIAAHDQPLIVAIDDLSVRKDHFKNYLIPNLFKPVAVSGEEALKNIRMILVTTDTLYDDPDVGMNELTGVALTIPLGMLDKKDVEYFSRELCILRGLPRAKADKIVSILVEVQSPTLRPGSVRLMIDSWLSMNP